MKVKKNATHVNQRTKNAIYSFSIFFEFAQDAFHLEVHAAHQSLSILNFYRFVCECALHKELRLR